MVDNVQEPESHKDGEQAAGKKRDVSSAIAVDATQGAETSTGGEVAAASDSNPDGSLLNVPKRSKTEPRKWLAPPRGERHTRVGNDFQVAALPLPSPPSKAIEETKKDETIEKSEEKNEEPTATDSEDKKE